METAVLYQLFLQSSGVVTDSRKVRPGQIFFALKGDNFDGGDFALKALDEGASYAVVQNDSAAAASPDKRIIPVEDTLVTLKGLAAFHREHVRPGGKRLPVIGLTGTNGKTTTKELVRGVLSQKFKVTATEGNLNNEIGVPLSVLGIGADTQVAVIEMGASHPDDISSLVKVCRPDFGLITNVGKAHLQGFGSFDGVKKAKAQLYDYISANGGSIFINADDPVLCDLADEHGCNRRIPYGVKYSGSLILTPDEAHPYLRLLTPSKDGGRRELDTRLVGDYNAPNVMAAIAAGLYFGVSLDEAISAVEAYSPSNNRSQLVRTETNSVIVDAYNANPTSMTASIDNFIRIPSKRKAVLLGSMGELGEDSVKEHVKLLEKLKSLALEEIFLVGEEFRKALECEGGLRDYEKAAGVPVKWFETSSDLALSLKDNPLKGCYVLVKGSRSSQMEKVVAGL